MTHFIRTWEVIVRNVNFSSIFNNFIPFRGKLSQFKALLTSDLRTLKKFYIHFCFSSFYSNTLLFVHTTIIFHSNKRKFSYIIKQKSTIGPKFEMLFINSLPLRHEFKTGVNFRPHTTKETKPAHSSVNTASLFQVLTPPRVVFRSPKANAGSIFVLAQQPPSQVANILNLKTRQVLRGQALNTRLHLSRIAAVLAQLI